MSAHFRTMSGRRCPSLLFVTYDFPPRRIIGSVRTWNIAKHLSRLGWAVTVLTPDPSLLRNVEHREATEASLEREGIRRLSTGHKWRRLAATTVKCANGGLAWFVGGICRRISRRIGIEETVGWVKPAERACSDLPVGDVDIILASGPPFTAFRLAQRLAERFRCPFVLDYRDLWSQNLHAAVPTAIHKEASVLAKSVAVTVVSPSWASVLDQRFALGSKLHVISNGYDAEELATVERNEFGHFAIVYTGVFYPPKRVVSPLMAALRRLEESHHDGRWMFHYYGRQDRYVLEEAERFGVRRRVIVHGQVPRQKALEAVKGAGVSVVITSVAERGAPEDNGMVTGKIFEAIGLGTQTLLIAPSGSDACRVAEATGLARSFTAGDLAGITAFLSALLDGESLARKECGGYAWGKLAEELDKVLSGGIRR